MYRCPHARPPCRTVRDRLLHLELAAHGLRSRGLWDVQPEAWAAADLENAEHDAILDGIAEGESGAALGQQN